MRFHAPIFFTLNLDAPHQASISLKQGRAISMKKKKKIFTSRRQAGAHPGFGKGGHNRGSGGETPSRQRIFPVFT